MLEISKYNALITSCPSQKVLDLIANKWVVLIIHALEQDTKRFSDLQRQVDGITQKMLTQTLRNLECDGIVGRKVYPVVPPKVEYYLTPLGQTLTEPLRSLCGWAEKHMGEVEEARHRYHGDNQFLAIKIEKAAN